jgi:hypothetical protein
LPSTEPWSEVPAIELILRCRIDSRVELTNTGPLPERG